MAMPDNFEDRVVLRIPAILRGMGMAANCVLEIWQEESSSGRQYTRCNIASEPPDLPDGAYQVDFTPHSLQTNKYQGKWELVFLLPDSRDIAGRAT